MRLEWLEPIRGLAIVGIVMYHAMSFVHGLPPFDHVKEDWPQLVQRLAQLQPIPDESILSSVLMNLSRYVGWLGYQGVNVFLVLSGFGLTWSVAHRSVTSRIDLRQYFRRRIARVFPVYWAGHVFFLLFHALVGLPVISTSHLHFYLSLAGLRFLPGTFFYISPAWWYVGLILQLYLIFPALWEWLRRKGLAPFWVGTAAITLGARFVALNVLNANLEMWSMGVVCVTRLFEFTFGMGLAFWLTHQPDGLDRVLRKRWPIAAAAGVYLLALACSFTRLGQVAAQSMIAVSLFGLAYAFTRYALLPVRRLAQAASWFGQQSYPLMILHHPIVWWFIPLGFAFTSSYPLFVVLLAGFLVVITLGSAAFGSAVEWLTIQVTRRAALR